jgi:hypothetical protein
MWARFIVSMLVVVGLVACQTTPTATSQPLNLLEVIVGQVVTFQGQSDRSAATYFEDGRYRFVYKDNVSEGIYKIDGDTVCVDFTDGDRRCDRYIDINGTYHLIDQRNVRYRVLDISPIPTEAT